MHESGGLMYCIPQKEATHQGILTAAMKKDKYLAEYLDFAVTMLH